MYRIYSNKRRGAYLVFYATSAALIWGQRLLEGGAYLNIDTRQIYFSFIFIRWYTFYLLILLWTDTKPVLNLELLEKFTREKKREFYDNESENISGQSIEVQHLFEGSAYSSK